jgi:5-methylthioribose kinase
MTSVHDTTYPFLTAENIAEYIAARPALAARVDPGAIERVEEIGDGNLNVVFRVRDRHGASVILKQALPYVRMTGEGWPMTPERARHEAESLKAHHDAAPDLVVETVLYDDANYVLAMEDLGDHTVWRTALNQGLRHDGAAAAVGRYVAAVAMDCSVLGQDRGAVSEQIARHQNPELCTITEDLVFTEPVIDAGRNSVLPANGPDAAGLAADPIFRAAMAEAKWRFMTQAETLIHGDLHTGSIMVRGTGGVADSVKVFDSEFAFYGPIAFDLGALYANYTVAAARALALGDEERATWCLGLVAETWTAFAGELRTRIAAAPGPTLWDTAFIDQRLSRFSREAWLFAAAKLARRIVGAAKVSDIETLPPAQREGAARGVLLAARTVAAGWDAPLGPGDFAETVRPLLGDAVTA